jgi:hypothetical protein
MLQYFWKQKQQILTSSNDTVTRLSKLNEQVACQHYNLKVELNVMRCATNRLKQTIEMEEQTQFEVTGTNQQGTEL